MLDVINISKSYKTTGVFSSKYQQVLKEISFSMTDSECLGIIGESGSGKSTLARLILGIDAPTDGQILLEGKNVQIPYHRISKISVVFQDYTSSINPKLTIRQGLKEPMDLVGKFNNEEVLANLLEQVGLSKEYLNKYPHELSGGQLQRVCIARAISTEPKLLVLDESVSSLDVSIQLKILELLKDIRKRYKISFLFITHDIQVAAYICDRLIILNDGRIIEELLIDDIGNAKKSYSKKLLTSVITI